MTAEGPIIVFVHGAWADDPVPFTNLDGSEGAHLYLDREAFDQGLCCGFAVEMLGATNAESSTLYEPMRCHSRQTIVPSGDEISTWAGAGGRASDPAGLLAGPARGRLW